MATDANSLSDALNRAIAAFQEGKLSDAEKLCNEIAAAKSDFFDALHLLAVIQLKLDRSGEALASFDRALCVQPDNVEALNNRGITLLELKRFDEAVASFDRAIARKPDHAQVHFNRGNALKEIKRFEEALASYERALTLRPDYPVAHYNRANTLKELKRYEEALTSYERALSARPDYADALNNRGNILQVLNRYEDSLACFDKALAINPNNAKALRNRGVSLSALNRYEEALACFDKALTINPDYAEALYERANTLKELKRFEEALACFEKLVTTNADLKYLAGEHLLTKMILCDWQGIDDVCAQVASAIREEHPAIHPFAILALPCSTDDHLKCAQIYVADKCPASAPRLWQGENYSHNRIRVAYLSADFRDHAVSHLLARMFEQHDRTRFEIIAVSLGPDDQSTMRLRLMRAFERFIDVHGKSDRDVARLLRELEVDIVVDLMGFTLNSRPAILSYRAAPIQVNYLSYPGIVGTGYMDYILADRFVIPEDQRTKFSEPVAYLPDSYLTYDSTRMLADRPPTRAQLGLPESGFVFCAFNNSYKHTPQIFDIWMRLLLAIEGSVLWLTIGDAIAMRNLRHAAAARGVDANRLVFAPFLPRPEDHLARHRQADLFLDTLPFNAQTTACDALWAGLPVVTRLGETFVGRAAGSALHAVGLPELITRSADEYEALALRLARDPALLAEIKTKLIRNRDIAPLFNTERFTRHMESAYTTMREILHRGERPRSFSVEPVMEISIGHGQAKRNTH